MRYPQIVGKLIEALRPGHMLEHVINGYQAPGCFGTYLPFDLGALAAVVAELDVDEFVCECASALYLK